MNILTLMAFLGILVLFGISHFKICVDLSGKIIEKTKFVKRITGKGGEEWPGFDSEEAFLECFCEKSVRKDNKKKLSA